MPQRGKPTRILIQRQRFRCKSCQKTFLERLADIDKTRKMTRRLVTSFERESVRRTFASLLDDVGIDEKTVQNILTGYATRFEATLKIENPTWMELAEIFLLRRPYGIITNVKQRTVVDLLKDQYQKTIESFLWKLDYRRKIEIVMIDMREPYRLAAKSVVPKAQIMVDKFHIVRMANNALEEGRRDVKGELDQKKRRTLKHDRYFLLKRRKDLKPDEQLLLETWTLNMPALGTAYDLNEDFF